MGYPLSNPVDDVLKYENSDATKAKQAIGEDGLGMDDAISQVIKRIFNIYVIWEYKNYETIKKAQLVSCI